VAHFAEGRDDPETRAFVQSYEKAYGKLPAIFAAEGYTGGLWLADALKKINGKVEDTKLLLSTVHSEVVPDSPLGKNLHMDDYGNPIFDIYIRCVTKRADGKLWNTVIATYPQVSQFWHYKPEEYMKQPPYSRTFQGIKK